MANADYSSCADGDTTGDTCTPTCNSGFYASTSASGFPLTCDGSGDFDGTDAALVCTGIVMCSFTSKSYFRRYTIIRIIITIMISIIIYTIVNRRTMI